MDLGTTRMTRFMNDFLSQDELSKCLSKKEKEYYDYERSFVHRKDFLESKRFSRYVKKTMDSIYDCASDSDIINWSYEIFSKFLEVDCDFKESKCIDFYSLMIRGLQFYNIMQYCKKYPNYTYEHYKLKPETILAIISNLYFVSSIDENCNNQQEDWSLTLFRDNIISGQITNAMYGYHSLYDIIYKEIENQCINYLRIKSITEDANENNFLKFVPSSKYELLNMFFNILNSVYINIEILLHSETMKEAFQIFKRNTDKQNAFSEFESVYEKEKRLENLENKLKSLQSQYESEVSDLKKEIEQLKTSLGQKEDELRTLNNDISKKIAKATNDINVENIGLRKENNKLTEKYNSLNEKYTQLKEELQLIQDSNDDYVSQKTINKDAKYLFVMLARTPFASFKNNIMKEFPNAQFCDGVTNISSMNIDAMVFITPFIKHNIYKNLKEQCRANNLPYVHCDTTNVERIKDEISKMNYHHL